MNLIVGHADSRILGFQEWHSLDRENGRKQQSTTWEHEQLIMKQL